MADPQPGTDNACQTRQRRVPPWHRARQSPVAAWPAAGDRLLASARQRCQFMAATAAVPVLLLAARYHSVLHRRTAGRDFRAPCPSCHCHRTRSRNWLASPNPAPPCRRPRGPRPCIQTSTPGAATGDPATAVRRQLSETIPHAITLDADIVERAVNMEHFAGPPPPPPPQPDPSSAESEEEPSGATFHQHQHHQPGPDSYAYFFENTVPGSREHSTVTTTGTVEWTPQPPPGPSDQSPWFLQEHAATTAPAAFCGSDLLMSGEPAKKKKTPGTGPAAAAKANKPVSAYALFFRDTHASIKAENPAASFADISKIVAAKWELLPKHDKDLYKERADTEKRSYLQNLASTKAKQIASSTVEPMVMLSQDQESDPEPPGPTDFLVSPQDPLMAVGQFVEHTAPPQQPPELSFGHTLLEHPLAGNGFDPLLEYTNPDQGPAASQPPSNTFDGAFGPSTGFFDEPGPVVVDNMSLDLNLDLAEFDEMNLLYSPHGGPDYLSQLDDPSPVRFGGPFDEPASDGLLNGASGGPIPDGGGAVCARTGCERDPVESSQWDGEFCSEECCVRYCAEVFRAWTASRRATGTAAAAISESISAV